MMSAPDLWPGTSAGYVIYTLSNLIFFVDGTDGVTFRQ